MNLLSTRSRSSGGSSRLTLALGALLVCSSAAAQYKVVNPDGSVTYTDRPPPVTTNTRVIQMGRAGAPAPAAPGSEAALPAELRQPMARYPVTLYTAPDCAPCDNARQFLQQRGIPYSERRTLTDEDAQALERIVGGRTVPALMVGPQPLRGFSDTDWTAYLDAAGYPRESRLPRGWQPPPATTVVERAVATAAPAARPAAPPPPPAAAETAAEEPAPAGRVRF